MSGLITSSDEISKIYEGLEILRSRGYTIKAIEEVLDKIVVQNDKFLIDFQVSDSDDLLIGAACFVPNEKVIKVCPKLLTNFIDHQIKRVTFEGGDSKKIRQDLFFRMTLYVLLHENEHVKQFLTGQGFIDCPYRTVVELYKNMFKFPESNKYKNEDVEQVREKLEEIKKIIFYFSKHRNSYKFILERNANVVVSDAMVRLCEYEKDLTFLEYFNLKKICDMAHGYELFWNGPAERSYYKLLCGNTFKEILKDEELSIDDKVLYGLPVDIKTRSKIMRGKYKL